MSIKCTKCGEIAHKRLGNYEYKEAGLDNVYLENISIYQCSCGASYPSIFRLGKLNDLIALTLIEKPSLLNGNEIKFLRKNLSMPSKLFAGKLGVGKTTLSKWENDLQNHSESNDRLVRAIYTIQKGVKREEQLRIQENLEGISLKKANSQHLIIAERFQDGYSVRYSPVVGTESIAFSEIEFSVWRDRDIRTSGVVLVSTQVSEETSQTNLHQDLVVANTAPLSILEGTETYATETA